VFRGGYSTRNGELNDLLDPAKGVDVTSDRRLNIDKLRPPAARRKWVFSSEGRMTSDELRSKLTTMTPAELAVFRERYGGDYTIDGYVDSFNRNPGQEAILCNILGIPTEQDRITAATLSSAQAAIDSAKTASEANRLSRHANWIALIALILSVIAIVISILPFLKPSAP